MGKITGVMEFKRKKPTGRPVASAHALERFEKT